MGWNSLSLNGQVYVLSGAITLTAGSLAAVFHIRRNIATKNNLKDLKGDFKETKKDVKDLKDDLKEMKKGLENSLEKGMKDLKDEFNKKIDARLDGDRK